MTSSNRGVDGDIAEECWFRIFSFIGFSSFLSWRSISVSNFSISSHYTSIWRYFADSLALPIDCAYNFRAFSANAGSKTIIEDAFRTIGKINRRWEEQDYSTETIYALSHTALSYDTRSRIQDETGRRKDYFILQMHNQFLNVDLRDGNCVVQRLDLPSFSKWLYLLGWLSFEDTYTCTLDVGERRKKGHRRLRESIQGGHPDASRVPVAKAALLSWCSIYTRNKETVASAACSIRDRSSESSLSCGKNRGLNFTDTDTFLHGIKSMRCDVDVDFICVVYQSIAVPKPNRCPRGQMSLFKIVPTGLFSYLADPGKSVSLAHACFAIEASTSVVCANSLFFECNEFHNRVEAHASKKDQRAPQKRPTSLCNYLRFAAPNDEGKGFVGIVSIATSNGCILCTLPPDILYSGEAATHTDASCSDPREAYSVTIQKGASYIQSDVGRRLCYGEAFWKAHPLILQEEWVADSNFDEAVALALEASNGVHVCSVGKMGAPNEAAEVDYLKVFYGTPWNLAEPKDADESALWILAGSRRIGVRLFQYSWDACGKQWYLLYEISGAYDLFCTKPSAGILGFCTASESRVFFFSIKALFLPSSQRLSAELNARSVNVLGFSWSMKESPPVGRVECPVSSKPTFLISLDNDKWGVVLNKSIRLLEAQDLDATGTSLTVRRLSILNGHSCNIYCCSFDGFRRLASIDISEMLIVWDVKRLCKVFGVDLTANREAPLPLSLGRDSVFENHSNSTSSIKQEHASMSADMISKVSKKFRHKNKYRKKDRFIKSLNYLQGSYPPTGFLPRTFDNKAFSPSLLPRVLNASVRSPNLVALQAAERNLHDFVAGERDVSPQFENNSSEETVYSLEKATQNRFCFYETDIPDYSLIFHELWREEAVTNDSYASLEGLLSLDYPSSHISTINLQTGADTLKGSPLEEAVLPSSTKSNNLDPSEIYQSTFPPLVEAPTQTYTDANLLQWQKFRRAAPSSSSSDTISTANSPAIPSFDGKRHHYKDTMQQILGFYSNDWDSLAPVLLRELSSLSLDEFYVQQLMTLQTLEMETSQQTLKEPKEGGSTSIRSPRINNREDRSSRKNKRHTVSSQPRMNGLFAMLSDGEASELSNYTKGRGIAILHISAASLAVMYKDNNVMQIWTFDDVP